MMGVGGDTGRGARVAARSWRTWWRFGWTVATCALVSGALGAAVKCATVSVAVPFTLSRTGPAAGSTERPAIAPVRMAEPPAAAGRAVSARPAAAPCTSSCDSGPFRPSGRPSSPVTPKKTCSSQPAHNLVVPPPTPVPANSTGLTPPASPIDALSSLERTAAATSIENPVPSPATQVLPVQATGRVVSVNRRPPFVPSCGVDTVPSPSGSGSPASSSPAVTGGEPSHPAPAAARQWKLVAVSVSAPSSNARREVVSTGVTVSPPPQPDRGSARKAPGARAGK